jgi:hypothetical protein
VSTLALDISISLDGYATGPNASDAAPMGIGGERLHAWAFGDDPLGRGSGPTSLALLLLPRREDPPW